MAYLVSPLIGVFFSRSVVYFHLQAHTDHCLEKVIPCTNDCGSEMKVKQVSKWEVEQEKKKEISGSLYISKFVFHPRSTLIPARMPLKIN